MERLMLKLWVEAKKAKGTKRAKILLLFFLFLFAFFCFAFSIFSALFI